MYTMVKTLLIDDEERATDALRLMIEKFIPEIGQVAVCNDARLAATMIHNFQPSLIFLDIRMPHLTGFDILNQMPAKQFKVIFTTAYNEFAVKAIRFSAFDYLLKPITYERFYQAIQKVRDRLTIQPAQQASPAVDYIFIKQDKTKNKN